MPNDAPSIRDSLQAAIDAEPAAEVVAPVESEPAPEPVEAAPEPAPARARDEAGRFAAQPKDPEKPETAPEGAKKPAASAKAGVPGPAKAGGEGAPSLAPPPAAAVETPSSLRPPQAWKPQAREAFAKAPPEVQAEVVRRETEITRTLNETAQARQVAQQTYQALSPYEGVARTRGQDAWSWAGEGLQERAVLQQGPVAQRAPILARYLAEGGQELVQQVAAILDGQAPQQHAAPAQPVNIQAEVQKVLQAQMQQAEQAHAKKEAEAFLATSPEYIQDVFPQMESIYAAAKASGRNMTYQQAYEEACWMNPDVRAVMQQKQAAEAAKARASTLPKAKAAASSIKASPVESARASNGPRTIREDLEAAVAAQRT